MYNKKLMLIFKLFHKILKNNKYKKNYFLSTLMIFLTNQ